MKTTKRNIVITAIVSVSILGLAAAFFLPSMTVLAASVNPYTEGRGRGNMGTGMGGATGTTTPYGMGYGMVSSGTTLTPLSSAESDALQQAILEEYGAMNLYQSVIDQLGNVYPFSMIVLSEQQHVNALVRQAEKYGIAVPENPGLAEAVTFSTLQQACQAGVAAETADAALYDELEPGVTHTDILRVFSQLQSASLNSHLPAFEACN